MPTSLHYAMHPKSLSCSTCQN